MSQLNAAEVIENQKKDWNRVAPAWEKWDNFLDNNMSFINYRLVGETRVRSGFEVLDLGCGTGYPALLSAQAVGKTGSVTALDLAEEMIAVARRKMKKMNLSNVTFQSADVSSLPFEKNRFNAVTSRFCLMFLPDIPKAVKEIFRVLKPGGYLAAAVWSGPDKNPRIRIVNDVINKYVSLPPPDPDQPGIFRLARPGDLSGMAKEAGFVDIKDEEMKGKSPFESGEQYLQNIKEMAVPLQALFAKLSPAQRDQADQEIKEAVNQYKREGLIPFPMEIRIVVGRKPLEGF